MKSLLLATAILLGSVLTSLALFIANHLLVFAIYAFTWGNDEPQLWVGFGFMLVYTIGLGSLVTTVVAVIAVALANVGAPPAGK